MVFLFWLPLLGERGKTINNRFDDAIAAKQGVQEELQFDAARLCDRRGENHDSLRDNLYYQIFHAVEN